jgi:hypothetical protein
VLELGLEARQVVELMLDETTDKIYLLAVLVEGVPFLELILTAPEKQESYIKYTSYFSKRQKYIKEFDSL